MKRLLFATRISQLSLVLTLAVSVSAYKLTNFVSPTEPIDAGLIVETIDVPVSTKDVLSRLPAVGTDITKLKPVPNSGELTYIALGGALTAGFRDGGLYREGQLGAYPNLLAHQLGLSKFQTPLFDVEHGNGTGYYQVKPTEPYPRWQQVDNNKGVVGKAPFTLRKYAGNTVHNLGMPNFGLDELYVRDFARAALSTIPTENLKPYPNALVKYPAYVQRLLPAGQEGTKSIWDLFTAQTADLCTVEMGLDLFLGAAQYPRNITISLANGSAHLPLVNVLDRLQKTESKVVVFTIPQVLDWPYFHIYELTDFQTKTDKKNLYIRDANNHPVPLIARAGTLFIPTAKIDATFQNLSTGAGLTKQTPVADEEVLSPQEAIGLQRSISSFNTYFIKPLAEKRGFAVVDLEALYKKILSGQYVTDDGYRIDPAFPTGNFFSSDGLHPSAIGQAVLTNEIIKVLNAHYQTQIPLIDVTLYSQLVKP